MIDWKLCAWLCGCVLLGVGVFLAVGWVLS